LRNISEMMKESEIINFLKKTIDIFSEKEIYLIKFYRIYMILIQPSEDEFEEIY